MHYVALIMAVAGLTCGCSLASSTETDELEALRCVDSSGCPTGATCGDHGFCVGGDGPDGSTAGDARTDAAADTATANDTTVVNCSNGIGIECSGVCVDTQTDASNCGGCGNACADGVSCSGGICDCGDGIDCTPEIGDGCQNSACVCGSASPCNPTRSNACTDGACACGTNTSCGGSDGVCDDIAGTCVAD